MAHTNKLLNLRARTTWRNVSRRVWPPLDAAAGIAAIADVEVRFVGVGVAVRIEVCSKPALSQIGCGGHAGQHQGLSCATKSASCCGSRLSFSMCSQASVARIVEHGEATPPMVDHLAPVTVGRAAAHVRELSESAA